MEQLFYEYIFYCLIVALILFGTIFIFNFFFRNGSDVFHLILKKENRFFSLNIFIFTLIYFLLVIILVVWLKRLI